jgi:hypothetical protein
MSKPEPTPTGDAVNNWLKQPQAIAKPALPDSFFDGDARAIERGKIREARLDLMQQSIEQLEAENIRLSSKVAQLEFCVGQHNQVIEWLRVKVTKLLWFVPTEEIDRMVEANGCDRYPRNWTRRTGGKLWRLIGGSKGK